MIGKVCHTFSKWLTTKRESFTTDRRSRDPAGMIDKDLYKTPPSSNPTYPPCLSLPSPHPYPPASRRAPYIPHPSPATSPHSPSLAQAPGRGHDGGQTFQRRPTPHRHAAARPPSPVLSLRDRTASTPAFLHGTRPPPTTPSPRSGGWHPSLCPWCVNATHCFFLPGDEI